MNKARRKELATLAEQMEKLDALRQEIMEQLESIMDEEQEALDNMPESLQESEKGQEMQEYIDVMQEALDDLEMLDVDRTICNLEETIGFERKSIYSWKEAK
jgi:flagellar biosynthesis chaperone FliJ